MNGNFFFYPNKDLTQRGIKDINLKNNINDCFLLKYPTVTMLYV